MIDVSITTLPASPLHALEIWSNPSAVQTRFTAGLGFALPALGKSGGTDILRLIRFEPTVWLVEGDASPIPAILAGDGALTAIGGGIVRIHLAGPDWRRLLMEGGVFDAESPAFAPGCSAATIINHVPVRLQVISEDQCTTYVPLSYSAALLHFWRQTTTSCD